MVIIALLGILDVHNTESLDFLISIFITIHIFLHYLEDQGRTNQV